MTNKITCRFLLRDRMRPSFKTRLFAGLFAVFVVLAPFQILAQENVLNDATKRLFQAVHENNLPAVQISITDGADIEAADENGLTPVDIAVDKGFFDIAHFLLSVRNVRDDQPGADTGQAADWTPTVQTPETVPKPPAPAVKKLSEAAAIPALPPAPAWPKGKPNPFDPGATGAALPVLGEVQGNIQDNPPPKAVAAVPSAEPEPALKPALKPKTARKISKAPKETAEVTLPPPPPIREVAEIPPPPTVPSSPVPLMPPPALKPDPGLKQKAPPPPPAEDEVATSAPLAVSERPSDGAQDSAGPSSIDRLADRVSKALKQEAGTGKARTGSEKQVGAPAAETKTVTEPLEEQSLKTDTARQALSPRLPPAAGAPAADVESEPPSGFIEKVSDFFLGIFGDTSTRTQPQTPKGPEPIEDDGGEWVVRDVETAPKKPAGKSAGPDDEYAPQQAAITKSKAPTASLSRYLAGIQLTLGRSVRLGVPPFAQGGAQSKPCIEKKNGALAFCIEDVDWPNWIEPYFQVNSIMYQGAKAIARYDDGVATSYHVIFPTGSYPAVVQYYTDKFGNPTKTLNRSIAPLAAPRRENPTAIWQSVDTVTKQVTTLEVREFDDARGTFPDTRRGAVMLYQQWSAPIFPNLSTLELMILNARARAQG